MYQSACKAAAPNILDAIPKQIWFPCQKWLSVKVILQIFRSSCLQMFCKYRPTTLLKQNSIPGVFLWFSKNTKNNFFLEHICMATSGLLIIQKLYTGKFWGQLFCKRAVFGLFYIKFSPKTKKIKSLWCLLKESYIENPVKYLWWSFCVKIVNDLLESLFDKVTGLKPATLFERDSNMQLTNFAKKLDHRCLNRF